MSFGYNGKILRVNLSNSSIGIEQPEEGFYRRYVGGRGVISYFLLKELKPGIDPLGPENKLIFSAGPVTGAPIGGSGRNSVGAKSPLTGAFGDAEVGGYWGAELKRAGYDAIIFEGKAPKPVYLWIKDGQAELRDAGRLWGKTTAQAQRLIQQELGDSLIKVTQIGPAGEKLVRFACVINDVNRAAGRTGMGAVMGSKNLKAVAVRGTKAVEIADPEAVKKLAGWLRDTVPTHMKGWHDHGTAGVLFGINRSGGLPTRNFQQNTFEGAGKINGRVLTDTMLVARRSCWACPVQCKREVAVEQPYKVDPVYGGPEYETLAALGSNCGIDDLPAIVKGNELCAANGLDTISTGAVIAFAMECFERGILTEKDTAGLKLSFGDAQAMLRTVELIASREGLGNVLAEGVARAAKSIGRGAEEYALHIKGQEVPMHEPRFKQGLGLGYAVSPTGADHCHNMQDSMYNGPSPQLEEAKALGILDPLPLADLSGDKVRLLIYTTAWRNTFNCLHLCHFMHFDHSQVVEVVRGVTGWNTSLWELMKVGERCLAMDRAFNVREGLGQADDYLPKRFFTPLPGAPLEGVAIDKEKLDNARKLYYQMMGWEGEQGTPSPGKLYELGIGWVADLL